MWQNFAIGGLTAGGIILGLAGWLGKVWASRILEKDRLKYQTQLEQEKVKVQTQMETLLQDIRTQNTKELFIHKLQFEKEFDIYNELWKGCIELRRALHDCYHPLQLGRVKSKKELQTKCQEVFIKLNDLWSFQQPFYSKKIYSYIEQCCTIATNLSISEWEIESLNEKDERTEDDVAEWRLLNKEKLDGLNKIKDILPDICDAIRERICLK